MPRVSVFMPSFNHERWVAAAIESVRSQTFQDFEIIVTDDASTDRTPDIIAAIDEPRLKLHRLVRNRGASAAMNDAISRCSGDYLALLNSDDLFLPHKLERQVAFLDAHPTIGAVFAYPELIDDTGDPLDRGATFLADVFHVENRSQDRWLRHFFFTGNCLCHPTIMVRRECYADLGGYDERLAQLPDFDMWIRLIAWFPIHILPEPLTAFRVLLDGANASAPRPDSIVRERWENTRVKRHYLRLPQPLFERVFAEEIAANRLNPCGDRQAALGRICLAAALPSLRRVGLELLHDALPAQSTSGATNRDDGDGFTTADYHRATGSNDIFNLLLERRIEQLESDNRALAAKLQEAPKPTVLSLTQAETPAEWPIQLPEAGLRLHLGCGGNIVAGWINLDMEPMPGARFWNCRDGLPFADGSVSLIYSEHMIEHLELEEALRLFRECFRVLMKGGVARFSTPDLVMLIFTYARQRIREFEDVGWLPATPCDMFNEGMRLWRHKYLFDRDKLVACLRSAGFTSVEPAPWRKSTVSTLNDMESRPYHHELIFEVQK